MSKDKISVDFKRDIEEIGKLTYEYFETTYIDKVSSSISSYKRSSQKKPSKEVQLIKAIIPFVEEEKQRKVLRGLENNLINSQTVTRLLSTRKPKDNVDKIVSAVLLYKLMLILEDHNKI